MMNAKALKFLLKLLSFPNYRAPLSQVKPTPKMKAAERNKICRQLCDRQWVACSEEIKTLTISPKGKSLLNIDPSQVSLIPEEFKMLQAIATGSISLSQMEIDPNCDLGMIENLDRRGLLTMEKKIKEVWLTESGQQFLVNEYHPDNYSGNLTFKMLADYLQLIRELKHEKEVPVVFSEKPIASEQSIDLNVDLKVIHPSMTTSPNDEYILQTIRELDFHLGQISQASKSQPSDEDILQIIQQLDEELGTDRYLPIFHLRKKLQSSFSREKLDRVLYRLKAQNKIQLKSLEEVIHYSPEYFEAAIAQETGWALFFILLTD